MFVDENSCIFDLTSTILFVAIATRCTSFGLFLFLPVNNIFFLIKDTIFIAPVKWDENNNSTKVHADT